MSQELAGQRSGEAETDHPAREGATRDSARLHRGDELSQLLLIHRNIPADLPAMPLPLHPDRYFAAMMRSCANTKSRAEASDRMSCRSSCSFIETSLPTCQLCLFLSIPTATSPR